MFNALTGADVFAKDLLFATLDPTMRRLELPNGQDVILSDTVGFISDLPTHLIAAFRATLEEAIHADVILHVIDRGREDYAEQRNDVIKILEELGIEYDSDPRIIEVHNKIDVLGSEDLDDLARKARFRDNVIALSAREKSGFDGLLEQIAAMVSFQRIEARFVIPYEDGKASSWLYAHTDVLKATEAEEGVCFLVSIEPADFARFSNQFGYQAG